MLAYAKAQWRANRMQRKADALRTKIESAVLEMGKTVVVGNVRASYRKGRASYRYAEACINVAPEVVARHTPTPSPNWRAICTELKLVPECTRGAASVVVKLVAPVVSGE